MLLEMRAPQHARGQNEGFIGVGDGRRRDTRRRAFDQPSQSSSAVSRWRHVLNIEERYGLERRTTVGRELQRLDRSRQLQPKPFSIVMTQLSHPKKSDRRPCWSGVSPTRSSAKQYDISRRLQ